MVKTARTLTNVQTNRIDVRRLYDWCVQMQLAAMTVLVTLDLQKLKIHVLISTNVDQLGIIVRTVVSTLMGASTARNQILLASLEDLYRLPLIPKQTFEKRNILAIESENAVIINSKGYYNPNVCFNFKDAGVKQSCFLTFRNEVFVFGGSKDFHRAKYQLSQLFDHEIRRIGELPFEFNFGACANVSNRRIYLCFNRGLKDKKEDQKTCHFAKDPRGNFTQMAKSNSSHLQITLAVSSNTCELN